jgi:hypothetical protein
MNKIPSDRLVKTEADITVAVKQPVTDTINGIKNFLNSIGIISEDQFNFLLPFLVKD